MKKTYKITVIGSGSWGTALSNMFAKNGINTCLYVRKKELCKEMYKKRENKKYLPDIMLTKELIFTSNVEEAMQFGNIILLAVPVKYLRESLSGLSSLVNDEHIFVSAAKGIENDTFFRPSEVVKDVLNVNDERFAVLSGPNFAKEVAMELPTATVVASCNNTLAKKLQDVFSCNYFRVYTSDDVVGVETAAAIKNVIAIAVGISDGLGFGNNAKASLITRGLTEMSRLGTMLGAKTETFMGLAGIGDLVLTCTGNLSRNRRLGIELSKNLDVDSILNTMVMVAEGVNTVKSVFIWSNKHNVDMPISNQVYEILYNRKNPKQAAVELMNRPLKEESL